MSKRLSRMGKWRDVACLHCAGRGSVRVFRYEDEYVGQAARLVEEHNIDPEEHRDLVHDIAAALRQELREK